jgi:hypothetical protein
MWKLKNFLMFKSIEIYLAFLMQALLVKLNWSKTKYILSIKDIIHLIFFLPTIRKL